MLRNQEVPVLVLCPPSLEGRLVMLGYSGQGESCSFLSSSATACPPPWHTVKGAAPPHRALGQKELAGLVPLPFSLLGPEG